MSEVIRPLSTMVAHNIDCWTRGDDNMRHLLLREQIPEECIQEAFVLMSFIKVWVASVYFDMDVHTFAHSAKGIHHMKIGGHHHKLDETQLLEYYWKASVNVMEKREDVWFALHPMFGCSMIELKEMSEWEGQPLMTKRERWAQQLYSQMEKRCFKMTQVHDDLQPFCQAVDRMQWLGADTFFECITCGEILGLKNARIEKDIFTFESTGSIDEDFYCDAR